MKHLLTTLLIMSTTASFSQTTKASTTKTTFHRETTVVTIIQSDEAIIWALLTNAADYPRWNSTVTSIEGQIALGEKIVLKSTLDAKTQLQIESEGIPARQEACVGRW
jgi:hypothetical protein